MDDNTSKIHSNRFKITITFKAEDLDRPGGDDSGNTANIINNEVNAFTRHTMQKELMELLAKWGDFYLETHGLMPDEYRHEQVKAPSPKTR